jgi:glycosyltransferase involved in cell wall biosynthesis
MRLAINLRLYVKGKIGGIENYVRNIMRGIAEHQRAAGADWAVFAHESESENVRAIAPGARVVPVTHETAAQAIEAELGQTRYDLFFCPLLVLDPLRVRVPSAVTIPDLQHEFFPEFFDENTLKWRRQAFRPSVFHADVVFSISEYSKSTIVEKFGVTPEKITVVDLDVDPEFRRPSSAAGKQAYSDLDLTQRYVYYPANFWKHKNHSTLLSALRTLVDAGFPDLCLVLTGAPSTGFERIQGEIEALQLSRNVRFLGYQPREVLVELYKHAAALAFISRFEGFGIPILEAFHCGTPVIAGNCCSCPEVAGGAALLVDPLDVGQIAAALRSIMEESSLRQELIEKGRSRAERYSWSNAVDLTLNTFHEMVDGSRGLIRVHDHPVVSIVTPTYNMGRFLEETIQSVLSQDYPNIDYIVMDGGSTDGTQEILRKYENRLRYRSGPDGGQADAINRGFELSNGQVFTFLNADDTYLPGAVGTAVRAMVNHRSAGVVYGDAYHVHEDGTIIGAYPTRPYDYDLLSRTCFICQPAAFMWRDVFMAAGGLNKDLHTALDYDLWIRIAKMYPLMKIDGFLATSRMYRENKTLSKRQLVYREIISTVREHYSYVPYDWVYGYSAYLIDRKDQIFDASKPSAAKFLIALLIGSYYNSRQLRRYWKEWGMQLGIGSKFTGRWDDGWISREYRCDFKAGPDCNSIVIKGRHLAPFRNGMTLTVRLNGALVNRTEVREHGPFTIRIGCPENARGTAAGLTIECNKSFRPTGSGDYRRLSCIINEIEGERRSQAAAR